MPLVKYLDYIENVKTKDIAFTNYEYPTQLNPKAILIYIHDNSDFGLNMGHLFRRFAHQGIRVYGFDRKGQGMSQGQRYAKDDRFLHN
jgi:alpha-beta hydrolase superfamily lysophospholipase